MAKRVEQKGQKKMNKKNYFTVINDSGKKKDSSLDSITREGIQEFSIKIIISSSEQHLRDKARSTNFLQFIHAQNYFSLSTSLSYSSYMLALIKDIRES